MNEQEFIPSKYLTQVASGATTWRAPSNIALVKYWGKFPDQIPANPSISFTLSNAATTTSVAYERRKKGNGGPSFDLLFEGKSKKEFRPKISTFFQRISRYMPFLNEFHLKIDTSNSFPHSSGIASSASGMAALALCLMDMEKEMMPSMDTDFLLNKASFLARLGSGSACRSISGPIVEWGKHKDISDSSDFVGVPYKGKVHEVFRGYQDTILLVHKGEKTVSSTAGHDLMNNHHFAKPRFAQAHENLSRLITVFETGDLHEFIEIVESEALTLHAMMMTSVPYFLLMKPQTLSIIEKIWTYRKQSGVPLCFTLDAGANVHLLYPQKDTDKVLQFIKNELVVYCENGQYICDQVGGGSKKV
jgi:diphosphomevalonate decarboxylase